MKPSRKPLAILLAALPLVAYAQEAKFSPIVVAAPKAESEATSNLGGADLAGPRASTSDAASLLRDVPGVSLYGAGGVSSLPVIHGLADDRVRVKVDGMDLISACANHMNPPLSYIDPTSVGSVKVFAGIAPVSAGGDSLAGAIQVDSAAPEFAQAGQGTLFKGQAGAFYRSNGHANGANISMTAAGESASLTYKSSIAESGNYKAAKDFKGDLPAAERIWMADGNAVGSSLYKSENQSLAFALRRDNHLFEARVGVQNIPYQGFPNQRMDMTSNASTQVNLRYTGQYQWGLLEARVYDENTHHKMNYAGDKQFWYGTAPGMPMETEGRNTGALVKADIALSERDTIKLGGEVQRYRLKDWWPPSGTGGMAPNIFWNLNDGQRDRIDIFAEWEARWNAQWLTQVGARSGNVTMNTGNVSGYNANYNTDANAFNARDHRRNDHNWDLTALARYVPDATKTFEAGYAQKTRSPNLYERYAWSTGGMVTRMVNLVGDGNGYVGNLDLKPEVAHTLSASADWHDAAREQWGLKVTPYLTYVDDYIDASRCTAGGGPNTGCNTTTNQTTANNFVYLKYLNQSARLYGLDVSGHLPLASTAGMGSFTATGLLSYTRGKNRTTGDNLYNIMPLNAKLAVVQRVSSWTNTAELQLVDGKTEVSSTRNELKTGGYALFNLRSSYEWKQARVDVGIENLFNRFYNLPLGGAYVGQGTTMTATGVAWGTPVPGMGRSIYSALNVKF